MAPGPTSLSSPPTQLSPTTDAEDRRGRLPGLVARLAVGLLAAIVLVGGTYGTYTYVRDYARYRGFAPPKDPPGVSAGHLASVGFFSPSLHATRNYLVYEPPGYQQMLAAGRRLPVLYLLHGSPGQPDYLFDVGEVGVTLDVLLQHHALRPMLLVVPDGRNGSFDSDTEWADTSTGAFESYIGDVIRDVDARFPTIPDRLDRGLAGYSEGAYASVNYAFHHLDQVSIAESWSGYFTQRTAGPFSHATPQQIAYNSPTGQLPVIAPRLRGDPLSVFIYSGTADKAAPVGQQFAAALNGAGATVEADGFQGAHDWRLWRNHMIDALGFADRAFGVAHRGHSSLHLLSPQQLAAKRAAYQRLEAEREIAYCRAHGIDSRSYCPVALGLRPPPAPRPGAAPAQLTLVLTPPTGATLVPGGVLRGTLSVDQPIDVTLTATALVPSPLRERGRHHRRHGPPPARQVVVAVGAATFGAPGGGPVQLLVTPEGRRVLRGRSGASLIVGASVRTLAGAPIDAQLSVRVGSGA